MPITHLIGGPRARARVIFQGDVLQVEQTIAHQPHPGGPTCMVTRVGHYRKFALVPTQAIWEGWRVVARSSY